MLNNKVAVVTGGGRGIGRAISLEFARAGADVAIIYAGDETSAEKTAADIKAAGRRAEYYRVDVSGFDAVKNAVDKIIEDFGTVDILVNNAGITRDGLAVTMSEKSFDDVIDTNLKGAFNMIRHVYPILMKKRCGRIINISSVVGISGNGGQANYSSAKAGLIGLTKSIARELAARNITCNAIAPGFISSDMTAAIPEKALQATLSSIPMKRPGTPEDVAALALFLASNSAAYITGEIIKIDGGMCM